MPKIATYDAASGYVTGWFDTDAIAYDPPPPEPFIEATEAQWANRMPGPWGVFDGAFVAMAEHPTVVTPNEPGFDDLREAARDVAAGLGLPGGGATWRFDGRDLDADQTIALYKSRRDGAS